MDPCPKIIPDQLHAYPYEESQHTRLGQELAQELAASPDVDFSDFDVLVVGPIVPEISAAFDLYWNADAVADAPEKILNSPDDKSTHIGTQIYPLLETIKSW